MQPISLLGCKCTLPPQIQFFIHQYPCVHLLRAAVNPFSAQPGSELGSFSRMCTHMYTYQNCQEKCCKCENTLESTVDVFSFIYSFSFLINHFFTCFWNMRKIQYLVLAILISQSFKVGDGKLSVFLFETNSRCLRMEYFHSITAYQYFLLFWSYSWSKMLTPIIPIARWHAVPA